MNFKLHRIVLGIFLLLIGFCNNAFSQNRYYPYKGEFYTPNEYGYSNHSTHSLIDDYKTYFNIRSKNTQTDSEIIIDSLLAFYSSGTRERRVFKYNEDNKIALFLIQYWDNEQWSSTWKITKKYDSFGNLIERNDSLANINKWEPSTLETYLYDSGGNMIEQLTKFYNVDNWENSLLITNNYNSNGELTLSLTRKWVDSNWVNSSRITYSYLDNNLKNVQLFELWDGTSWQNYWFHHFIYEDNLDLSEIIVQLWENNQWNNFVKISMSYYDNEVVSLLEVFENNEWKNNTKRTDIINENHYVITGINENFIAGNWFQDDGLIVIENPDGFFQAFLAKEVQLFYGTETMVEKEDSFIPELYYLNQNYPNPFNPTTQIGYQIPENGFVKLVVYNTLGEEVATLVNQQQSSGQYSVQFNADNLPSGVYIYKLQASSATGSSSVFSSTQKMLLIK